ncbi:hypothetical protein [Mycobacterium marseillense]|uniref:hypothetical protein n=1 Tax=Mycobacterium marseillense TaxID=701042 RepID=UPI0015D43C66|nr:hypothetical protein [Mycobacterium marseillense]
MPKTSRSFAYPTARERPWRPRPQGLSPDEESFAVQRREHCTETLADLADDCLSTKLEVIDEQGPVLLIDRHAQVDRLRNNA